MRSISIFGISILLALNTLANEAPKIKVATSPAVSTAGVYLAQEKGFFKAEGLDVEITVFNSSGAPMTVLLAKGEIDVGAGNLTAGLYNAINKGNKLKVVADKGRVEVDKKYIAMMVRKDLVESGRYKSLKDLKDLKVSLTSMDGLSQQIVLDKMLVSVGLTDKDITLVKLSYPEAIVAFKTKAIDATVTIEPYIAQSLIDNVAVNAASSHDYVPNQQSAALLFSPQFAAKKEVATKFMRAYIKGVRAYNESLKKPELAIGTAALLKKYMPIENGEIWRNMIPVGLNNDAYVSEESIQSDLNWYKEKNYIEKIPNIKEFVDNSFVEEALKSLNAKVKKVKKAKSKKIRNQKTKSK